MLAKQGNIDAAIDQMEKALALDADLAQAHHNLGVILREKGRPETRCRGIPEGHGAGIFPGRYALVVGAARATALVDTRLSS